MQAKWDAIYTQSIQIAPACKVLSQHLFLLPKQGRALDLACGISENALLLAESGLITEAWDISAVALQKLQQQAELRQLNIIIRQCGISAEIMPKQLYDIIVISRFLDRTLSNAIMAALKPDGLLFYQTFSRHKLDNQGPNNPDYLLDSNELLNLFAPLKLIFYQEYDRIGDLKSGDRNEVYFIGQKT